ncbi:MAG: cellulase family glycosylhydrolase [Spirochaetales bacterium]|nr:cellulase family glycosylhydrolase [Spirochaetales bacterium]
MKKLLTVSLVLVAIVLLASPIFAQPVWRVNQYGQITKDNQVFRIKGGSWFGLEGRHEPSNDQANPSGAPMEQYMGNVFWAPSGRTYDTTIADIKAIGFNTIRLPLAPQALDPKDPQGSTKEFLKNAPEVLIENSRLALETIIKKLDTAGMYVMLDIHSCSNYVGWRAGRLDARPPYADKDRDGGYDFLREDCSCAATNNPSSVKRIQEYNESKWLADLKTLAGMSDDLGVDNIIGIDIFNEPWDYSWAEWSAMIDKAYNAINSVNSNILVFAQGIGSTYGNQDGNPDDKEITPHGEEFTNPNWGENFYEAGDNPPSMPKNRLVYSPHTYGPSVFVQRSFMDPSQPECEGLEGDEAGDNECNIIINPTILEEGWDEHFGYLKLMGYGMAIGEFGGNITWPDGATTRDQNRYKYLQDKTVDLQWQKAFFAYLAKRGITDSFYWSINPESGDTGGVFDHAYDPVSNTGGWGTWRSPNQTKVTMLKGLWNAPEVTPDIATGTTPPNGETPTPTGSTGCGTGDANRDGSTNIVDSLLIAQYYVQQPVSIDTANSDVNGDGSINIVDALLIAQKYVGIISEFTCN